MTSHYVTPWRQAPAGVAALYSRQPTTLLSSVVPGAAACGRHTALHSRSVCSVRARVRYIPALGFYPPAYLVHCVTTLQFPPLTDIPDGLAFHMVTLHLNDTICSQFVLFGVYLARRPTNYSLTALSSFSPCVTYTLPTCLQCYLSAAQSA